MRIDSLSVTIRRSRARRRTVPVFFGKDKIIHRTINYSTNYDIQQNPLPKRSLTVTCLGYPCHIFIIHYNQTMKKPVVIFFLLLITSALLYLYKLPQMATFDADQDYYAQKYVDIVQNHQPTLLGIEASVGGIFVAPLYTYFSTLIYAASAGDPMGIFLVSMVIAALQGPLTYLLFSKLKNQKTAVIAGLLVVFSELLWHKAFAPSVIGLIYLAGLFFFYYLCTLSKNPKSIIMLGLICGLGINLHVSLFAFVPVTIIYLLWKRPRNIKISDYIVSLIVLLALSSPLFLFDIRHRFFLFQNLLGFLQQGSSGADSNYPDNVIRIIRSIINTFAFTLVPQEILGKLLVLATLPYLFLKSKSDKTVQTAGFVLLTSFLMFCFYFGDLTDYYFHFLLAPFIFVFANLLGTISSKRGPRSVFMNVGEVLDWTARSTKREREDHGLRPWESIFKLPLLKVAVATLLCLMFIIDLQGIKGSVNPYNYFVKKQAVEYIKSRVKNQKTKIYFDTDLGYSVGYNYLFKRAGINIVDKNYEFLYQIVVRDDQKKPGKEFIAKRGYNSIRVIKLSNNI